MRIIGASRRSGSLAKFAAMRRASSRVSRLLTVRPSAVTPPAHLTRWMVTQRLRWAQWELLQRACPVDRYELRHMRRPHHGCCQGHTVTDRIVHGGGKRRAVGMEAAITATGTTIE